MEDLERLKSDRQYYDLLTINAKPGSEYFNLLNNLGEAFDKIIAELEIIELEKDQGTSEDRYHR